MSVFGNDEINSHRWTRYIPAPSFQMGEAEFQRRLDRLFGTEPDGTKRVQLVWIPRFEVYNVYLKRWLPIQSLSVPDGEAFNEDSGLWEPRFRYVGIPRWGVVGKVNPDAIPSALLVAGTDQDKTDRDADLNPHHWKLLFSLADHYGPYDEDAQDMKCCVDMMQQHRVRCFGAYRPPCEDDLKMIESQYEWHRDQFDVAPHLVGTENDRWTLFEQSIARFKERQRRKNAKADDIIEAEWLSGFNERTYSLPTLAPAALAAEPITLRP